MSTTLRALAAATLSAAALVAPAAIAHAGGATTDTTLNHGVGSWLEVGAVPGILVGNAHRGGLSFLEQTSPEPEAHLGGRIEDWTCPPGVLPPALYAIEDPDTFPETTCTLEAVLQLDLADTTLTVADRLSEARVAGTALVRDAAGDVLASVPIDVTLTAVSAPRRQTDVFRYVDDGTSITDRTVITTRDAEPRGTLGTIGIGDEDDDAVDGSLMVQETTIR